MNRVKKCFIYSLIGGNFIASLAMNQQNSSNNYLEKLPTELKGELEQFIQGKSVKGIVENWTYPSRFVFSRTDLHLIKKLMTFSNFKKYFAEYINPATGMTPLMKAAETGDHELVNIFLNAGIDVNKQDKFGWTALMYAATTQDQSLMDLLINKGANQTIKNNDGKTAANILKGDSEHRRPRFF